MGVGAADVFAQREHQLNPLYLAFVMRKNIDFWGILFLSIKMVSDTDS
jgi:hypothetical protein